MLTFGYNRGMGTQNQSGIYAITHIETGRLYVGSSIDIQDRWRHHKNELKKGLHANARLQNAWKKYGADAFDFTVMETVVEPHLLLSREQSYLDELVPFFNILKYANFTRAGIKHSEEAKAKIKEALAKPEAREKLRQGRLGVRASEETREKIAAGARGNTYRRGKPISEEQKQRHREFMTGRKDPPHMKDIRSNAIRLGWETRRRRAAENKQEGNI